MTWLQIIRLGVELAIDAVRGKLGSTSAPTEPPASALRWKDVEIQARASRNAGHEPPTKRGAQ